MSSSTVRRMVIRSPARVEIAPGLMLMSAGSASESIGSNVVAIAERNLGRRNQKGKVTRGKTTTVGWAEYGQITAGS
ncbi:hypothetical protein ACODT3_38245 [Streptomyces sp. 4.24]|uniref:hypothetical protein n=1 Tax=Streptomyces tritrimontium TaxID=3406573 RepID=UPI003BB5D764